MSKRDFFILTIKLFGLSSVVTTFFSVIPANLSYVLMDIDLIAIGWIMTVVIVVVGLFVVLVFKADKVVERLKLDKGFDDNRIELGNLKSDDIIKIGTFILGGLMIIDNIPGFLSHVLFAFRAENLGIEHGAEEKFSWVVTAVNLIVGYLLVTNYGFVADKMKSKSGNDTT